MIINTRASRPWNPSLAGLDFVLLRWATLQSAPHHHYFLLFVGSTVNYYWFKSLLDSRQARVQCTLRSFQERRTSRPHWNRTRSFPRVVAGEAQERQR